jgi:multidrug efflux pump subunit AcrB
MPVDALPEFAPPSIEVQTESLGLSAPEVESLVTLNLEELLNGTPWLKSIHSTSVPGLSSILLTFEPGTDVLRARQLVQERLTLSFAIPNVAKPPIIIQPLSTTNRVMMVGLSSKTVSPIEMGVLARWNIRPALLAVPGVANVAIWGQRERQLQVQVEPQRLLAADVTLDQIVRTTGNAMWVSPLTFLQASTPGSGGWIDTPSQRLEVRHIFPISTASDLAKVGVDGASPLRLSDVANVVADHQPLIGDAYLTGGEDSLLVIEKFPNANTLEVTRGVEAALAKLQPGLAGIDIDTSVSRPATYIDDSISNLTLAVVLGAVLLIAALAALLGGWRSGLIAVVAIPLSLAAALLALDLRGATVNLMVIAGLLIALALLVDDAVTCTQTIAARLRADREAGRETPAQALVLEGAVAARRGLLYVTLIAVLPLLP